jgi:hypothetical protein
MTGMVVIGPGGAVSGEDHGVAEIAGSVPTGTMNEMAIVSIAGIGNTETAVTATIIKGALFVPYLL